MVRHDMRIASPQKPGLGYGPYPNYVHVDKIKDNVVIKETTAEEIHAEFDRRLRFKNDRVEGHNELVKERRKQMREEGVDEKKIEEEGGKFQRSTEKSAFTHRAYSLVLGLSDDAFALLGADVPRTTLNEILTTALRTVRQEIGIDENELTHVVIHWDETHPHLHAGLPYLNKSGERFQKNFSPAFLSKLICRVNLDLAEYGMKPPKTYKERKKRETHKSTKELKKETQRAHEIFLEHSSKAANAKNEAELAETEARIAREKLMEVQRQNSDYENQLAELANAKLVLEKKRSSLKDEINKVSQRQDELVKLGRILAVKNRENENFEKEIGEQISKLEAEKTVLQHEKAKLNQIKLNAGKYLELQKVLSIALDYLLELNVLKKAIEQNSTLGKTIIKIAKIIGYEHPYMKAKPAMEM